MKKMLNVVKKGWVAILIIVIICVLIVVVYAFTSGEECKNCNPIQTPTASVGTPNPTLSPVIPTSTPTPTPYATANPTSFPVQPSEDMQDLGYCSFGCGELIIGNGVCDLMCNNEYCNYDGGDCD